MTGLRSLIGLATIALLIATSGCAHTQALQAEIDTCKSALDGCNTELASAKKRISGLEKDVASAKKMADIAARRTAAYKDIADRLRAAFGADGLEIIIRNGRLVVQLPNKILFDLGKSELKAEGKEALTKLATVLRDVPERAFLVAGHTDNTPVRKDATAYRDNWELSTQRGLTVVRFLMKSKVSPTQLGAAGYGEFFPEAANDTDENRAQNRRTEIIIMPLLSEIPELPESL